MFAQVYNTPVFSVQGALPSGLATIVLDDFAMLVYRQVPALSARGPSLLWLIHKTPEGTAGRTPSGPIGPIFMSSISFHRTWSHSSTM